MIGWKNLKTKCLEYYVCFTCRNKGIGEVAKRDISKTEVEEAIKSKSLYVIEAPDYPKSDDEKKRAAERFEERFYNVSNQHWVVDSSCELFKIAILKAIIYYLFFKCCPSFFSII